MYEGFFKKGGGKLIAEVIVDIAAHQTDRLFEYTIPTELEDVVQVGSRVVVNFGKNRKLQGFVVGLATETDYEGELKDLLYVVDEQPPLTQEMVALSAVLSKKLFTYRINILKTMLPAMMKAKYHKVLIAVDEQDDAVKQLFDGQAELDLAEITDPNQLKLINHLLKTQKIQLDYRVENKARVKTTAVISAALAPAALQEQRANLKKNAVKLRQLLDYFVTNPKQKISQKDLKEELDVSASVIKTAVERGYLRREDVEVYRKPVVGNLNSPTKEITLNSEQVAALTAIKTSLANPEAETFLLEGVTGSGKTEVYLQSIAATLAQGKTALMLVPEISLTPQMVRQVYQRFQTAVAVLHSGLSLGEQFDEWRRIRRGEVKVVVGARSAVFAPLENLGLIIMDEEHESSYKQDENPRYHARDVALLRAKYYQATVILGSATPSLETRARAQKHVYQLLTLTKRANQNALPQVKLVDLKTANFPGAQLDLSAELVEQIKDRLQKKQQVILLLNRRGFANFMLCRDCGFVLKCPNCDISLTYHKDIQKMKCHYCGHLENVPQVCPNCQSTEIRFYGTGTQKIADLLAELVPSARVLRMDVDTMRKKGSFDQILTEFGRGQADILLGTQMIAKGLDFANVTLVGVINADTSLNFADYKAAEKTFQLLTQVSGRAGRGQLQGEVLIQTYNPDHYAIQLARTQDYENFYAYEMQLRHQGNYPPYFFTTLISISSKKEQNASRTAFKLKQALTKALSPQTIILGPTPNAVAKIKEQYYYQILVKYKYEPHLTEILTKIQAEAQEQKKYGVNVYIDLEPEKFN